MSEFTTVYVKRETADKIRQLAEIDLRKQYDLVALAVAMYEQAIVSKAQSSECTNATAEQA